MYHFVLPIKYRKIVHDKWYVRPFDMTNQYFPKDIVCLNDSEVFRDCGGYIWRYNRWLS